MPSSLTAQAFAQTLLTAIPLSRPSDVESETLGQRLSVIFERLWQSSTDGNACIELSPGELSLLKDSAAKVLVGEDKPLMLDQLALYLNRYWHAENRLAHAVHLRLGQSDQVSTAQVPYARVSQESEAGVESLSIEAGRNPELKGLAAEQVQALQAALVGRLTIIYGGPGTGKTRTIASLLEAYARLYKKPIWVAAPTAKAGARLMESLQALMAEVGRKQDAEAELLPEVVRDSSYLPTEALTIQRLLSRLPLTKIFFRDEDQPLEQWQGPGLLVVDEASMLSLELCVQLFARLSLDCRLVLVGDPNQLHSVETGSVFAGLCEAQWPSLKASRVQLKRNFRQSNRLHLSQLADGILRGEVDSSLFAEELKLTKPVLGALIEVAAKRYAAILQEARDQLPAAVSSAERALAYLKASGRYRVVSARRSGIGGADRISEAVLAKLKAIQKVSHQSWFEGRLITITRNDAASGLFNGDTGVCVIEPGLSGGIDSSRATLPRVLVAFERSGAVLTIPAAALPHFQDGYCLSVHQAQGSEFDHVDFVAAPAEHRLATRELLYTAVTRAKSSLNVFGEWTDLRWAASHPTVRHSRLPWRIDHPRGSSAS
jgi:exodeoxyribonuclease V alpha subunit